jgi:hypothetical protein
MYFVFFSEQTAIISLYNINGVYTLNGVFPARQALNLEIRAY